MHRQAYLEQLKHTWRAWRLVWRRRVWATAGATAWRGSPALRLDEQGQSRCTACGRCAEQCPTQCIRVSRVAWQVDERACMCCGLCVAVCPEQALQDRSEEER